MTFDWSEYFALARQLAADASAVPSDEARQRAAIGRAYFAAFCRARNCLRDREGLAIPTSSCGASSPDDVVPELARIVEANLLRSARVLAALDAAETGSSP